MIYNLAKLTNEAKEQVLSLKETLDETDSTGKLIALNIESLETTDCPDDILFGIQQRFLQAKHTVQKLK